MNVQTFARKLVVIITEGTLERIITQEVTALGANGYTVSDVRGKGSRGARESSWEADRNIRIEVMCDEAMAQSIAKTMRDKYYSHYAMTLYITDIEVLRPEKF